jgi:hypothetical protein
MQSDHEIKEKKVENNSPKTTPIVNPMTSTGGRSSEVEGPATLQRKESDEIEDSYI